MFNVDQETFFRFPTRHRDQQHQHPDLDPRPGPAQAGEGRLGGLRPAPDQAHFRTLKDQEVH